MLHDRRVHPDSLLSVSPLFELSSPIGGEEGRGSPLGVRGGGPRGTKDWYAVPGRLDPAGAPAEGQDPPLRSKVLVMPCSPPLTPRGLPLPSSPPIGEESSQGGERDRSLAAKSEPSVRRGSHDPAGVPDRRSPAQSIGCAWEGRRPSVDHSGGVWRPTPNVGGRRRGGFTLIELLVVILIILLISAVALPTVVPAISHRQVSEAGRILQGSLVGARDAAIHNNGPSGVRLLPDPVFPIQYKTINNVKQIDPTVPLAYNRIIPIEPAPQYSEGKVNVVVPTHTS